MPTASRSSMLADPPARLPGGLNHLSASSVRLLLSCPEKWRRRYLEGEYEPSSPSQLVGSAVHRAEGENFAQKAVSGRDRLVQDVLDAYSDEWDMAREEAQDKAGVEWEDEKPGRVKDSGVRVLSEFHRTVARRIQPAAAEQRFEIQIPGVEWTFVGYRDVDETSGDIADLKVRSQERGIVTPEEAAEDLEATAYLFARRAELAATGSNSPIAFNQRHPSRLRFLNLVRSPHPKPRDLVITPTTRSDEQLDTFLALLYRVAAEVAWRAETDVWHGPGPGSWWCSERFCGFWARCPFGGAHRPSKLLAPAPVRRPDQEQLIAAVKATCRRDGTTTAARVGAHLGLPTPSAAGRLAGLARHGVVRSEDPKKPPRTQQGRKVYRLLDDGTVARQLEQSVKQIPKREEVAA